MIEMNVANVLVQNRKERKDWIGRLAESTCLLFGKNVYEYFPPPKPLGKLLWDACKRDVLLALWVIEGMGKMGEEDPGGSRIGELSAMLASFRVYRRVVKTVHKADATGKIARDKNGRWKRREP